MEQGAARVLSPDPVPNIVIKMYGKDGYNQ